jgi:pimeloyl-ACP methyl ester carboxylesterase
MLRRRWLRWLAGSLAALALVGAGVWFTPSLFVPLMTGVARMALGISVREVTVDGRRWSFIESGRPDAPPALLLHGFGTSREAMMSLMVWLSPTHRCIAPDLPGFGTHAYHDDRTHDADFYVRQIVEFADALGLERFDVVGTSMGGALAAHLAARHPDRVRRLVLLAPAGIKPPVLNEFMREVESGGNPLDIASEADFDRVLGYVFARQPLVPWQFRAWMTAEAIRRRPNTLRIVEAIRPFLLDGLRGELASVRAPTLVVWGDRDRVTDRSMMPVFTAGIPGATGALIRDAGHVVFGDAPEETRRAVVPFLAVDAATPLGVER